MALQLLGHTLLGHSDQAIMYCQGRNMMSRKSGSQSVLAADWPKDLIHSQGQIDCVMACEALHDTSLATEGCKLLTQSTFLTHIS